MPKIGEYEIKRPDFIIFTDKDGTLNFEDKQLSNIFSLITSIGGLVIPITGRTIGDIESDFIKRKIKVPEIIIGDNGANIYYAKSGEFLLQKVLEHEKVATIIDEFIKNGGNKDYIRYTNGSNIFASNEKAVKSYYKKSTTSKLCKDIYASIQEADNITKITLAGSKELMQDISIFVNELDFWSDMDVTKFPDYKCQNYRLDISQKDINKGEAVKWVDEQLKPKYGYVCVGNGYNDMSMFKKAIDYGMRVAIMQNSPSGLLEEVKQYAKNKKRGKVCVVPNNKDLANKYILRMAKHFQENKIVKERKDRLSQRLPNVQRVNVDKIDHKNSSSGKGWQIYHRDR